MRPNPPVCENRRPYCSRAGQVMKCIQENEQEWVFSCVGCGQVNILTKPEFKKLLREQARAGRWN